MSLPRIFLPLLSLSLLLSCSDSTPEQVEIDSQSEVNPQLAEVLRFDAPNPYDNPGVEAPDQGCTRIKIRNLGGPLYKVFNDSNYLHLEHAYAAGIRPIDGLRSAWQNGRGLVVVRSDRNMFVDSLKHSYPYLKPHAAQLLSEIAQRFHDTLQVRGGGDYRIKVTSLLRTPATVKKLRRVNRNATSESAHQFATTFDISYSKFICDNAAGTGRTFEDLKNLLGEILSDLKSEGRCMVKIERKQSCYHITATAPKKKCKKK